MAQAVAFLVAKKVSRIILARPAVEAGEKLGFLPGDLQEKVNPYLRPLYDALYDMLDVERVGALHRARHHRDRADRVHARPDAQRLVRHPRRGAEHDVRADEDVPDAPRLRRQGRDHRRHHADRSADGPDVGPGRGDEGRRVSIEGISFIHFDDRDVVRHKLVQQIVKAYEAFSNGNGAARPSAVAPRRSSAMAPAGQRRARRAAGRRRRRARPPRSCAGLARWLAGVGARRARAARSASRSSATRACVR